MTILFSSFYKIQNIELRDSELILMPSVNILGFGLSAIHNSGGEVTISPADVVGEIQLRRSPSRKAAGGERLTLAQLHPE